MYELSNLAVAEEEHHKKLQADLETITKQNEDRMNVLIDIEFKISKQTEIFQELRNDAKVLEEQVELTISLVLCNYTTFPICCRLQRHSVICVIFRMDLQII